MRLIFLIFISLLTSCSCKKVSHFKGIAMQMPYHVQIGKACNPKEQYEIEKIIEQTFQLADRIYNHWNPDSELSKLNEAPAFVPISISPHLSKLLAIADEIVHISEGKFDPTIGKVIKLWKESQTKPHLENLKEFLGWDKIHFTRDTFCKESNEIMLDLDGIAKGYTVDLLTNHLNEAGYKDVYVEWAGDIRATGMHPEKRKWSILIINPVASQDQQIIDQLLLCDGAVASSGDAFQRWQIEDKTFFHIIDPDSLLPLEVNKSSIASATVLAKTCALADGLATSSMIFRNGKEAENWAKSLQDNLPDVSFWIITHSY